MATMPIEIVLIGREQEAAVSEAIALANRLQEEFEYARLKPNDEQRFAMLEFEKISAPDFLDALASMRKEIRGYHPFVIGIVDAIVDGRNLSNLFCSSRGKTGLGVLTSANVPATAVPGTSVTPLAPRLRPLSTDRYPP